MKATHSSTFAVKALTLTLISGMSAEAVLTTYTSRSAFLADITTAGLTAQTLDFDSQAVGNLTDPQTVEGITFSTVAGPDLRIDNSFEGSSAPNYLGGDSIATFNQFTLDDSFSLSFSASNSIGLNLITAEIPAVSWFSGDIAIDVPGIGNVALDQNAQIGTTPLGDRIFFIGLIDDSNTFTSADFTTPGVGTTFYNIDDISVSVPIPEPGIFTMITIATLCLAFRRRRMS